MSEKIKAIKSSAEFNLPFNGVMYSRIIDLSLYLGSTLTPEELTVSIERINRNDPTLNPDEHTYHLHTILALLKVIDMEAEKQNVVDTMTVEEFRKQAKERMKSQ